MEQIHSEFGIIFPAGTFLVFVGSLSIVVSMFRTHVLWGIAFLLSIAPLKTMLKATSESPTLALHPNILLPALILLTFFIFNWKQCWKPHIMAFSGAALIVYSLGV